MKVVVIPIVTERLIQSPKDWYRDLDIRRRVEIIYTTALIRSDRIQRRVMGTRGDLLLFKFLWKPSANATVENPERSKQIIIILRNKRIT